MAMVRIRARGPIPVGWWVLLILLVMAGCRHAPRTEAAGLLFDVPAGFTLERARAGSAQAFVLRSPTATLVLAWRPGSEPPEAGPVLQAALRGQGEGGTAYAVAQVTALETRLVAGRPADYAEAVWAPVGAGNAPSRQVMRVLLFSGPQATYLAAMVAEEGRRDDPASAAAWERFVASLRFKQP